MIDWSHPVRSIQRQCELLGVHRSTAYQNRRGRKASKEDLRWMRIIDELHHEDPTAGSRRLSVLLRRKGEKIGRKRTQRLMRAMGVEAIFPRKKLSKPCPHHRIYPYLLRNREIEKCNEVWCTDITYIPMSKGFLYLVAVMDWHSRKILSWRLSNTLDTGFCMEALNEAVNKYGVPEIFNTDQGSQFTSKEWTDRLVELGISISMDGRGAWRDNVMIERFWRTLKYEEVYLWAYEDAREAAHRIGIFIQRYNDWRPHSYHGEATPTEIYEKVA